MMLSENSISNPVTTRFAPSPTGLLHLGHAVSALTAWTLARGCRGRFLLRIEDLDAARCTPEFRAAILRDLGWLGIDWDGPVRVQSQHRDEYRAVLDRLAEAGLVYPCFCSRSDILREVTQSSSAPHQAPDGAPLYPGTCRRLDPGVRRERIAAGEPLAWRLDMQAACARLGGRTLRLEQADQAADDRWRVCRPERFGDVVLGRRDFPGSYHLCATHDDWAQQVSLVTRGVDLRPAADLHRLLQDLLGWTAPAYAHHHLVLGADGRRLAKRDHGQTLGALRESGMTARSVRAAAGFD